MSLRLKLFLIIPGLSIGGMVFFVFITYQSIEKLSAIRSHDLLAANTEQIMLNNPPQGGDVSNWIAWVDNNKQIATSKFTMLLLESGNRMIAKNIGSMSAVGASYLQTLPISSLKENSGVNLIPSSGLQHIHYSHDIAGTPYALTLLYAYDLDPLSFYIDYVGVPLLVAAIIIIWVSAWVAAILANLFEKLSEQKILEATVKKVEEANRSITAFLANMSHELRTPLNAIIGFSDTARLEIFGPIENEKYRDYVGLINQSGKHLLHVIGDILDMTKIEAGMVELSDDIIDLPKAIGECVEIMSDQAEDGQLELFLHTDPGIPLVHGDSLKFKQIILNLLSNAIKFTPSGGRVEVTAKIDGNGDMLIRISDTGCGMNPEDIPIALKPFGQIRTNVEHAHEGTGLGLSISKRFTELQGATFEMKSDIGRGTDVTLRFPPDRIAVDF